jgi:[acyl-carrier-protein] S-malonyltransferase
MKIVLCPGQGSQTVGMFVPWIEQVPGFEAKIKELAAASGKDLIHLGTLADEETIRDTANAQPLIVAFSIAAFRTAVTDNFDAVAGHSVGEFAAAAIAGVLSDTEAMRLVAVRAEAMANESRQIETSMAAVIGGDPEEVERVILRAGLSIANYNGAGQVVAAGTKERISNLVGTDIPKARVIELKVAGAFHTSFMQPAIEKLKVASQHILPKDPIKILWSNFDGRALDSGTAFLDSLIEQVARPVRWDLCMQNFSGAETLELPPAGALSGLVKRGADNVGTLALKLPSDVLKIGNR